MYNFQQRLEQCAALTEQTLDLYLPQQEGDYVTEAMRYSLLGGGKRLRAALALEFCRTLCADQQPALPFACALEMVHAYSLIHDDLPCMDDDDMRRGKPSCHIAFGEAVALLAGDGLLTKAFEVLATHSCLPPERTVQAVQVLAQAAGHLGMIGGQRMDLENEKMQAEIEQVEQTDRLKTGALICAAAKLGCIAAGADEERILLAESYAQKVGLAFQITDDILDCTGDEKTLGKPTGSDEQNHKTTYVSVYGVEQARQVAQQLLEQAKCDLDSMKLEEQANFLYDLADYVLERRH